MKVIAKFSDYIVQSIEYFINVIDEGIKSRDISGLTLGPDGRSRLEMINISKEHPLVVEMRSVIENKNQDKRSNIIPAISVTPGNMSEEGIAFGESLEINTVDDNWIISLKNILPQNNKDIHADMLISHKQIEDILGAYKKSKNSKSVIRYQSNMWSWNEEINVSSWTDSPDMDILMGTILDSILAEIRIGTVGDESQIKNMKYRPTKGLTNFNFGHVLFGTEFNITFLNTYHNYIVFEEEHITGHNFDASFKTPEI
jgi:hypothetical protein